MVCNKIFFQISEINPDVIHEINVDAINYILVVSFMSEYSTNIKTKGKNKIKIKSKSSLGISDRCQTKSATRTRKSKTELQHPCYEKALAQLKLYSFNHL